MNDPVRYNLIGISTIILLVAIYTVDNLSIKFIADLLLVIGLIYSLIRVQKSVDVTINQKRFSWFSLFPILILIGYLFTLLKHMLK